jgi:hypothetical protein
MSITAYPLSWPSHFPRTKHREAGRFQTSINGALGNVQRGLELFAKDSGKELDDVVISSNVTMSIRRPDDPGVAIWFLWDGVQVVIPIDRYTSVSNNLQAIHHIIRLKRGEMRHGSLELVKASFRGFLLPAATGHQWWSVLGVTPNTDLEEIRERYRRLAALHHPDRGGDPAMMAQINDAWREAQYQ